MTRALFHRLPFQGLALWNKHPDVSFLSKNNSSLIAPAVFVSLQLEPGLDLTQLAASCHGYSGADLAALARETALAALARAAAALLPAAPEATPLHHQQQQGEAEAAAPRLGGWEAADWGAGALPDLVVRPGDVAAAMRRVGPSIVRGIEVEVPHTRWGSAGLMAAVCPMSCVMSRGGLGLRVLLTAPNDAQSLAGCLDSLRLHLPLTGHFQRDGGCCIQSSHEGDT